MKLSSSDFRTKLRAVRKQICNRIKEIVTELGGTVCLRMYHDNYLTETYYTYFEVDDDGHGVELFTDTVSLTQYGDIDISLHDSEDFYEPVWCLKEMSTTDVLYLLEELEEVVEYHKENGGDVFTEYDPDWEE